MLRPPPSIDITLNEHVGRVGDVIWEELLVGLLEAAAAAAVTAVGWWLTTAGLERPD